MIDTFIFPSVQTHDEQTAFSHKIFQSSSVFFPSRNLSKKLSNVTASGSVMSNLLFSVNFLPVENSAWRFQPVKPLTVNTSIHMMLALHEKIVQDLQTLPPHILQFFSSTIVSFNLKSIWCNCCWLITVSLSVTTNLSLPFCFLDNTPIFFLLISCRPFCRNA